MLYKCQLCVFTNKGRLNITFKRDQRKADINKANNQRGEDKAGV